MKKRILIYATALLFAIGGVTSGVIYALEDPLHPAVISCDGSWEGKDFVQCWVNNPEYHIGVVKPCIITGVQTDWCNAIENW
jgi:hypothetical protein